MSAKNFGVVAFYNEDNPLCPFLIKPEEEDLFIFPVFSFEDVNKLNLKNGDRASYELMRWQFFAPSDMNGGRKRLDMPVKLEDVNLKKRAVNIEKVKETKNDTL